MTLAELTDAVLDTLGRRVLLARADYPGDNYAGRVYFCESCRSLHGCCAPADELTDGYPCPECATPQIAFMDAAVPDRPATRSQRRRRP